MARRKLSEEEANRLKGELSPFSLPSPSPHIVFFAKKGGVTYSLYSNLTLLTQGEGEIKDGRPRTCPRFKPEIGSDEVGTGDYFGPIVVTAAFVDSKGLKTIERLGVTDSKLLSDKAMLSLAPELEKSIDHESILISASRYNKAHDNGFNMNAVKAYAHNAVLLRLAKRHPSAELKIDQFCDPLVYFHYLDKAKEVAKPILFKTKGELSFPSIAAASVLSRILFLREMEKLSRELGAKIPFGAGREVDEFAKKIVSEKGADALKAIAKISFKNTAKILGE